MIKSYIRFIYLFVVLFIVACGGGGGGGGDTVAPTVNSTIPSDSSTLKGSTPIVIRFSESILTSSLNLTGSMSLESNGGVWSTTSVANDTLTLMPAMTWRHNTGQSLGVDVSDVAGNSLAQTLNLTYNVDNKITRVSVDSNGVEGNHNSTSASLGNKGRYIAFQSTASNLVSGPFDAFNDVFLHDYDTGTTSLISMDSNGVKGNLDSLQPSISSDGRYIAFRSDATNLVPNDTNGSDDIFVHDRMTGATSRVSVASDGTQADAFCADPMISGNGRYVTFRTVASTLVANDTNAMQDIFVHDRNSGITTRVSVDDSGVQGNGGSSSPGISADGRYVAYDSDASNLVAADTNGATDIFVHDLSTSTTSRMSIDSNGVQANSGSFSPKISANGRYVVFTSIAGNLVTGDSNSVPDIFIHDRNTGNTSRVSITSAGVQANLDSYEPVVSGNGRYVAFSSDATNLDSNDTNGNTDIFVHDRTTGNTMLMSANSSGTQGNSGSTESKLSEDGRYLIFRSIANNLVVGDTNGVEDIFITPTPY